MNGSVLLPLVLLRKTPVSWEEDQVEVAVKVELIYNEHRLRDR